MKKFTVTLLTLLTIGIYSQDVVYNFNTNNESFTQGGMPNYLHNADGYLTTGVATSFTGGFQQLRTPAGLGLSETKYRTVRIVVENSTANTEWQIMNFQPGSTSGSTAGRTDFTIASVAGGSGYTTYDIPITVKTTTPDGIIDRIAIRAKQGNSFDWSAGGELKIAQMVIVDNNEWVSNADFESSSNWTASGADITGGYTTTDPQVGSQAATVTFTQDATGNNNYLSNDIYDFGETVTTSEINTTFYVKSTRSGINIQVRLLFFDAGGSQVASSFTGKYEITAADTWEPVTLNKTGLSDNFNQLQVTFRIQNDGSASGLNGDVISFDQVTTNYNPFTVNNSWTGSSDTSWTNTANWTNGVVPSSTLNSDVQVSANNPIIGSSTAAAVNDLEVDSGASLTINAGGSLIVSGTSTGNVTYNRTLTSKAADADGWHLVSSPVAGQAYNNAYATANSLATSTTDITRRGLATFNDANDPKFDYLLTDDSNQGTFTSGIGYSMKRSADGTVSFTGTINTDNVNGVTVSDSDSEFVLLGVPYTSYISSQTFLAANTNLDQTQIWVWEQGVTGGNYIVGTALADNFILAPGQGFFVKKATTGATVNFAESNQQANADTFKKSSRTEIKLLMNDGENNRFAKFYYVDNVTKGFDAGWEGETFGGVKNSFDVFSQLMEDNQGKSYQVQSLPLSELESLTISVGVIAEAGKEITFSALNKNLPSGVKTYLEDRLLNTFTELTETKTLKVTLNESLDGIGRFFLHTKSSALNVNTEILNSVSIYKTSNLNLRISGLEKGNTVVSLFNMLGKQVMKTSFEASSTNDISLPKLATGVYLVKLQTENGKLNKKIILE